MSFRMICCSAIVLAAGTATGLISPARAGVPIDTSWVNPADGFWGTAANWDNGVPNNAGMNEYNAFISVTGAPYTATLDLDVTANNVTLDSALGEAVINLNGFNFTLSGGLNASNGNMILGDGSSVITLEASSSSTMSGVMFENCGVIHAQGPVWYAGAGDEFCDTDIDHDGPATIDGPGTVILQNSTVFKINSTGTLNLNNNNSINTTMGTPSIVNDGTVIRGISGAAFTIDNVPLTNNGLIHVTEGTLSFSGAAAVLDNSGMLEIDASKTLEAVSGATLSNFSAGTLAGGEYNVKGTLRFDTGGAGIDTIDAKVILDGAGSTIQNSDTSDALAATDTIAPTGELDLLNARTLTTGGDFDNQGMVSVDSGAALEVPAGNTLNNFDAVGSRTLTGGRFEVHGTGTLKFDAGAMGIDTIDSELILDVPEGSNPVRNSADASAIALIDTIGDNGRIELSSGFDVSTAASFTVAPDGELVIGAGSVFEVPNTGGNQLINFGGNVIQDGSFEVQGVLRAPGLAVQTIGNVGNPSQITLDSQLFDGMNPVPHFQDNANNNSDAFAALQTVETGSSLTLLNGAMLNVPGALTVRGRLVVSGSGPAPLRGGMLPSSLTIGGPLTQETGEFELGGGELNLQSDYLLGSDATLAGAGNVNFTSEDRGSTAGHLVWNGSVAPGAIITGDVTGALDIDGSATLSDSSIFAIDLGGRDEGTFDRLSLTGAADFSNSGRGLSTGELRVTLTSGFAPALGDEFDVMYFAEHLGTFQTYTGMDLGNGLRLEAIWSDDNLTLIVVPAPSAFALFFPLSCGVLRRGRRNGS